MVVRNLFGFVFVLLTVALAGLLAAKASPSLAQLAMLFTGVQLALSVFSRADYLFTDTAQTGAGAMPSDVANMADALFLPYWFWGGLIALISLAIMASSFYVAWVVPYRNP